MRGVIFLALGIVGFRRIQVGRAFSTSLSAFRRFFCGLSPPGLGGPAQSLFFGALAVEFEEAGEDFVAKVVGPAEAPGLAPAAGWEFLVAGC